MTTLLLLAYLGVHALFLWGMRTVFRTPRPMPAPVRLIVGTAAASIATGAALVATRRGAAPVSDLLALLACAGAAALFAWAVRTVGRQRLDAAFCGHGPDRLVTDGPYRWLRNPFYAAYLVGHAVPLLAARNLWALPGPLAMALIYRAAVDAEERQFQAGPLAAAWRAHAARTGRFLPRLRHTSTPTRRRPR